MYGMQFAWPPSTQVPAPLHVSESAATVALAQVAAAQTVPDG